MAGLPELPDRLACGCRTWRGSTELGSHAEAAQCMVHGRPGVAEYLALLEDSFATCLWAAPFPSR